MDAIQIMKVAKAKSLYFFYLQVITLWGLMLFLIWLILRPKHPIYKVVNVYISNLDGRNSTLFQHGGWNQTVPKESLKSKIHGISNSTNQNISIILNIEISNPNKRIGIYHDDIKVALYHNDSFIGNNSVAAFHQGYRNTTFCEVKVDANYNHQSWTEIMDKKVDLKICIKTGIQYVYGIFRCKTKVGKLILKHTYTSPFWFKLR